jgi:diacylglycerol kinase family enzyme
MTNATVVCTTSSVRIIVNSNSGQGDKGVICKRLEEIFKSHGKVPSIAIADRGSDLPELAHRAVQARSQIVVAAGGDGTINAVASALVDTGVMLGVIPLGTLNHFAKDLKIPMELEAAALNITSGHAVSVDVGEVNGRIFINNSSIGLYPLMVLRRNQQQHHGRGKWTPCVAAGIEVLRRYPFLGVRVRAEDLDLAGKSPFVFIGNNMYELEGFRLGSRQLLNSGTLGLYMASGTTRIGLLGLALRTVTGRLRQARDFCSMSVREVRIESGRHHLLVSTDGEVALVPTPLQYRVRAGALRVIVPAA